MEWNSTINDGFTAFYDMCVVSIVYCTEYSRVMRVYVRARGRQRD